MFCPKCGMELSESANFCPRCGSKVVPHAFSIAPKADNPATTEPLTVADKKTASPATVESQVANTRRRSRGKIPVVFLIILIVLAVATAAFAAYMVYTQVVAPPQEETSTERPNASSSAQEGKEEQEPASYTYSSVSLDGSDTENINGTLWSDLGTSSIGFFSYIQINTSIENPAVESLNGSLASAAKDAYAHAIPPEAEEDEYSFINSEEYAQAELPYYDYYASWVSYSQDNVISVVCTDGATNLGVQHWMEQSATIMDLSSGQTLKAEDIAGLSEDEIKRMSYGAIDTYFAENSDNPNQSYQSANEMFQDISFEEMRSDGELVLYPTKDGIVLWVASDVMGTHAYGNHNLLICDLEGKPIATGTDYNPVISTSGEMVSSGGE